ncbi:bacterio-opsin activator domain-containing protein [Natrinema sp. SYSU A 869]|uniref:bacterio-opsin activator domain-containing protein n=1 Tax=Natrinema sp. SYSU A 869 TaxID=2871694 RepID=UPI001CA3953A|nr:bacterio-opsin activator domain-containing protein [Natrinema sp. SYSU A 869]
MVVLLEFTIDAEGFVIGEILKQATGVYTVELERVIPLGERPIPFLWVTSDDLDTFEENVLSHPLVQKVHKLERIDDHGLYRIEWAEDPPNNLLVGIQNTNGTLLDAHGGENWFSPMFANICRTKTVVRGRTAVHTSSRLMVANGPMRSLLPSPIGSDGAYSTVSRTKSGPH